MKRLPIKHGIELAPVVDIVFLLLTSFLLSATVASYSVLDLRLPEAGAGRPTTESVLDIRLRADGTVLVERRPVERTALRASLDHLTRGRGRSTAVRIAADGRAPYEAVVFVLDTLRAAGLTNVELATEVR